MLEEPEPVREPRLRLENRYRGKAELRQPTDSGPAPLDYPVTNMVLVAEKR